MHFFQLNSGPVIMGGNCFGTLLFTSFCGSVPLESEPAGPVDVHCWKWQLHVRTKVTADLVFRLSTTDH